MPTERDHLRDAVMGRSCPYCGLPYRKHEGRYCVSCGAPVQLPKVEIMVERDVEELWADGVLIYSSAGPPRKTEKEMGL